MRCDSSTSYENSRVEVTADAPFGGASPQSLESVEEEEKELPAVTDCTSLALVDAVQSESALLLGEKQNLGVEPKDCLEGTFSAAPVAPNFEEQAQPSFSASLRDATRTLIGKNLISSNEDKTHHVDPASAASAPNADKWSSEALFTAEGIAIRSKIRPLRMEKLKLAGMLGEKPDFEFLAECWNDDPALQIVIKKLVAKFGQWGIACVDGVLVKCDE
ncbi:hypothetical protein FNW02_36300 [Komarekiella sp. 'clone 1']|uniref:Uncharacterized protein n=1 Tax=Komarekiella delphini-convector SJRDD-AB1 TaxID=2593771 RepID=A0AA40VVH3_9NOST|nr:hypothetical protein [Komarekiella delphini-convector SJRDD-AB1]